MTRGWFVGIWLDLAEHLRLQCTVWAECAFTARNWTETEFERPKFHIRGQICDARAE